MTRGWRDPSVSMSVWTIDDGGPETDLSYRMLWVRRGCRLSLGHGERLPLEKERGPVTFGEGERSTMSRKSGAEGGWGVGCHLKEVPGMSEDGGLQWGNVRHTDGQ